MKGSRGLMLAGAAMAGVVASAAASTQAVTPVKKAVKRRQRAKAKPAPYANFYSRSKYIPGGEYRNCGDRGISPKLVLRHNG